MIYEYHCRICGADFELSKPVNLRDDVYHCGIQAKRKVIYLFNTTPDLMYNFKSEIFGEKSVEIHSRRQYKGLLKQHNLADASIKECRQQAKSNRKSIVATEKTKRKKHAKEVAKIMYKDGVIKHFPSFVNKFAKKKDKDG